MYQCFHCLTIQLFGPETSLLRTWGTRERGLFTYAIVLIAGRKLNTAFRLM